MLTDIQTVALRSCLRLGTPAGLDSYCREVYPIPRQCGRVVRNSSQRSDSPGFESPFCHWLVTCWQISSPSWASVCCSAAKLCQTLCDPVDCSTPAFPVLHYLLEFAQIHVHESMMPANHLILCCLLLLLPSIFPSIRVFSNESALCIRWPKCWSFSFSISQNIQGWFPSGLTGLIFLLSKGLSRVFSNITV